MEDRQSIQSWLSAAVGGIRFKPDRVEAERELRGHIEDKMADLRRLYPDLLRDEAEKMALDRMGDPEEIGKELAKIHKPWLGWLWRASQIGLAAVLALSLWTAVPKVWESVRGDADYRQYLEEQGLKNRDRVEAFYLEGTDPFETGAADRTEDDPVRCRLLELVEGGAAVRAGHYRLRLAGAALWSLQMEDGTRRQTLFCDLRAAGLPWEPMSLNILRRVSAVDSLGNRYPSLVQWSAGRQGEQPFSINAELDTQVPDPTPLEKRFCLALENLAPGAEWVRLEYSLEGVSWELTIPLGEEERG